MLKEKSNRTKKIGTIRKQKNKNSSIKAIIIAAGMGSRLKPLTNNKPKCLLKIRGRTILERQLEGLRGCGINDISLVRGYKKEMLKFPGIKYYENTDYLNNNILSSLFFAEKEMDNAFIFSYSDIIYQKNIVEKLLQNNSDISLVVDYDWLKQYTNRKKHPVSEAELVKAENGKIARIGKSVVTLKKAQGEFIGLAKFSKKGAEILKEEYQKLVRKYQDRKNQRFQNAAFFEKAYLTDMIQYLINRGYPIDSVDIKGGWVEIDTDEDIAKARKNWQS